MPSCKSRHAQVAVTSDSRSSDYITVRPIDRSESGDSTGVSWRGHSSLHEIRKTLTRVREFARSFPVQSRWRYKKTKWYCAWWEKKKRSVCFVVCTVEAVFLQYVRDWKAAEYRSQSKGCLERTASKVGTWELQSLSHHFHHWEDFNIALPKANEKDDNRSRFIAAAPPCNRCATRRYIIRYNPGTESNHRHRMGQQFTV